MNSLDGFTSGHGVDEKSNHDMWCLDRNLLNFKAM